MDVPEQASASQFLALPRELRDQIYLPLLFFRRPPPRSPEHCSNHVAMGPDCWHAGSFRSTLNLQRSLPLRGFATLRLLSRQIKAEVEDLCQRLFVHQTPTAELDLMVKAYSMWVTWTDLPLLLTTNRDHIPKWDVLVTMRIYSTEAFAAQRHAPGKYCLMFDHITWLLYGFNKFGPMFTQKGPAKPRRIGTLRMDVEFLDMYLPSTHPPTFATIIKRLRDIVVDPLAQSHADIVTVCAAVDAESKVWKESGVATEAVIEAVPGSKMLHLPTSA